jgi:hypothetical protein
MTGLRYASSLRRRGALVVAGVLATVVIGSGSAYAYWTGIGSGSGSASTGTAQTVTLLPATATVTTPLVPGGTGDLLLRFSNPNAYDVTLISVQQAPGSVGVVNPSGTCSTTGVTVPTSSALAVTVASGASVAVSVPNAAAMSTASDSGCQGASFQIPVTVAVRR